jgi:hypothetical protein
MLVAARDSGGAEAGVYELNASGGVRRVFGAGAASVTGVRTLAGGQYLVTGTFSQGASVLPGITTLSSSGDVTGRLEFPRGFPWGALAMPNGGFLVIDSTVERQLVQFPSATLPALVPPAVDTTTASGAHPTQQRAAVLSADARHLLVAAQNDDTIHEYEVSEAGVIDGASRRVYAALPDASPRSLAFDVCGNLYVSAHARSAGGTLIGALLRIPAGGGAPFTLATFDQPDTNRVIAFGRGGVFPSTNLYVADASAHVVLRVKVGVEGAQ